MKGSVWPWVLAAGGIAFGFASWLSSREAPPVDEARIAALERKLEEFSREQKPVAGASPRSMSAEAPRRANRAARASVRAQPAANDPSKGELQASYAREPVDTSWAPGVENRLMQVARTEAILSIEADPPTSQRIDCRSTTCRLEFIFANEADATDWTLAYLTGIGNNLARARYFTDKQPDGSIRITMYGHK